MYDMHECVCKAMKYVLSVGAYEVGNIASFFHISAVGVFILIGSHWHAFVNLFFEAQNYALLFSLYALVLRLRMAHGFSSEIRCVCLCR